MMDMALHSFDDQYLGCREQVMEELERGDYFQKEIAANKDYLSLWKKAQEALLKSPVGLLREMQESHAIVLMTYTMNSSLHSQLNWATSIAGSSPEHYRHNFSFKYFHFYLTTAIQIMKQWQSSKESTGKHKCYRVHRGVKDLYIKAMESSKVQFGRFTSTSRLWNEAQKFGNETLFTVTTCLGAAMQGFSYYVSEKEVLIFMSHMIQFFTCLQMRFAGSLNSGIYSGGFQGCYTSGLRTVLGVGPLLLWEAEVSIKKTTIVLVVFSLLQQHGGTVSFGKAHT
uniref:NAD(P)(+)--arginine ADP-ribosyltransferase n=1 Tax=Melopsittacus undulatus TaxID=13146 RepID=A0A8C6JZ51_MELUD